MLLFFLGLTFISLLTSGLHVSARPVRRRAHAHNHHMFHSERASDAFETAKAPQVNSVPSFTTDAKVDTKAIQMMAGVGLAYGVAGSQEGSSPVLPQRDMLPCIHRDPRASYTPSAEALLGHHVPKSTVVLEPTQVDLAARCVLEPLAATTPTATSQKPRQFNFFRRFAIAGLAIQLPGILGVAMAVDAPTKLGDSPIIITPVANSNTSSLQFMASPSATGPSTTLRSSTSIVTATSPVALISQGGSMSTTVTSSVVPTTATHTTSTLPTSRPLGSSLTTDGVSGYTSVFPVTTQGLPAVESGLGSTKSTMTEQTFVFSRTTIITGNISTSSGSTTATAPSSTTMPSSTTAPSSAPVVSSATLGSNNSSSAVPLSTSSQDSVTKVIYSTMSPTFSGPIKGYTTITANTGQTGDSSSIATASAMSSVAPSQATVPAENATTSTASSYVSGSFSISTYVPDSATSSSLTGRPKPGNITLNSFSRTFSPLASTASGTIYTTVTATKSFVTTSTIAANMSTLLPTSGTRNMSLYISSANYSLPQSSRIGSITGTVYTTVTSTKSFTVTQTTFANVSAPHATSLTQGISPIIGCGMGSSAMASASSSPGTLITPTTSISPGSSPVSTRSVSATSSYVATVSSSTSFHRTRVSIQSSDFTGLASSSGSPASQAPLPSPTSPTTVPTGYSTSAAAAETVTSLTTKTVAYSSVPTSFAGGSDSASSSVAQPASTITFSFATSPLPPATSPLPTSQGTFGRRDEYALGHGSGASLTSPSQGSVVRRTITCASPLTPIAAVSRFPDSRGPPVQEGVCPSGWTTLSSGGQKRIRRWSAAEVVQAYSVAGLVVGAGMLAGAIVRAVEDGREVVDGTRSN